MGMFRSGGDVGFMIGPPVVGFVADHFDYAASMHVNGVIMIAISLLFLLARETGGRAVRAAQRVEAHTALAASEGSAGEQAEPAPRATGV